MMGKLWVPHGARLWLTCACTLFSPPFGGTILETAAKDICRYSKRLVDLGLMASMSGNLSVMVAPGVVLMTPTSSMKDELRPEDLVTVDLHGHILSGDRQISTEGWMHLAMYRARPAMRAVVHAHPPHVTALGMIEQQPSLDITSEGAAFVGPIGMVEWIVPGGPALGEAVGRVSRTSESIILRQHGAVTGGSSLQEAFARMQSFEHAAKVYLLTLQYAVPRALPAEDIRRMRGE